MNARNYFLAIINVFSHHADVSNSLQTSFVSIATNYKNYMWILLALLRYHSIGLLCPYGRSNVKKEPAEATELWTWTASRTKASNWVQKGTLASTTSSNEIAPMKCEHINNILCFSSMSGTFSLLWFAANGWLFDAVKAVADVVGGSGCVCAKKGSLPSYYELPTSTVHSSAVFWLLRDMLAACATTCS